MDRRWETKGDGLGGFILMEIGPHEGKEIVKHRSYHATLRQCVKYAEATELGDVRTFEEIKQLLEKSEERLTRLLGAML